MSAAAPASTSLAASAVSGGGWGWKYRLMVVPSVALGSLATGSPAFAAAPDVAPAQPPGTEGLNTVLGWLGWGVSFACVAGLLVVAAMMAMRHRRGEGGESISSLGWVLGACVLGSAAGPIANSLM